MSARRAGPGYGGQSWDGLIVFASTTSWDDTWLSEKHLALHLSKLAPVLWVDPPVSILTPLRKPAVRESLKGPRLRVIAENLARLTPTSLPGVSRPVLHEFAEWATRRAIERAVRRLDGHVRALVVASLDDLLHACKADITVLYGTDDWIAGGELMGIRTSWLEKRERRQLGRADLVVCVSDRLKERWSPFARRIEVIPNGCDTDMFASVESVEPAPEVTLSPPIAGFIGHISERIDREMLQGVADTGASLLLVGPRQRTFDAERIDELLARENVQWVGAQSFESLPSYMKHITVGLTPYTDSEFNRGSDPLKTLEYLSAGRPAVVSDLPSARKIPSDLIRVASSSAEFVTLTLEALAEPLSAQRAKELVAYATSQNWDARARRFLEVTG